jgi:hypothetical protein
MKDSQTTFRLPRDLARALTRRAQERRVTKSQLVREALETYLAGVPPEDAWRKVTGLVGSLALDPAAIERDQLASQLRTHNWRE